MLCIIRALLLRPLSPLAIHDNNNMPIYVYMCPSRREKRAALQTAQTANTLTRLYSYVKLAMNE